jgi:hypothetical protein
MTETDIQEFKTFVLGLPVLPHFGSKAWADELLKIGIASIRDIHREPNSRILEFVYQERLLREHGFTWHSRILSAWAHRFWWSLRPSLEAPPFGDHPLEAPVRSAITRNSRSQITRRVRSFLRPSEKADPKREERGGF